MHVYNCHVQTRDPQPVELCAVCGGPRPSQLFGYVNVINVAIIMERHHHITTIQPCGMCVYVKHIARHYGNEQHTDE